MSPGLLRSALGFAYVAVRTPLSVLDEQVVTRCLGQDSPARRPFVLGVRSLDALAAKVLADPDAAPPTRTGTRTETETETETETDGPNTTAGTEQGPPAEPLPTDEQREIQDLADAYLAADELAPRAGELAEDDEVRRVQAEIRAKQAVEDERGQL